MFRWVGNMRRFQGGFFMLIALGAACSGTVEQRYEKGAPPSASGGTNVGGVGGALGDAGIGAVGGTTFGGTNFGGTGAGGTGTGGAVGFANGGLSGVGGTWGSGGSSGGGFGGTVGFGGNIGCFVAGTPIATPSGTRPIEELRLGDLVLAYDERAGRVVERPVTATFTHPDQPVGALPLSDGRVLRVTANHPIYLPDQQRYADAGALTRDERLLTLSATAQTSSLIAGPFQVTTADSVTVYNITVAGEHNYFAEGVLVHNKTDGGCVPSWFSGLCSQISGCLDPTRPTSEYVRLNQVVGAPDAGPGPSDAGPVETIDAAPGTTTRSTGAAICSGSSVPPDPSYLAFDIMNKLGDTPAVGIYENSNGAQCQGNQLGEIWFNDISPPPRNTTTSQCISVPPRFMAQLTLAALNAGTEISNPRFVARCDCPRRMVYRTTCGLPADVSGACEATRGDG